MTTSTASDDKRCSTGIEGLGSILGGGLPRGNLYLAQGDPGSGKTTLAIQFLLEGVRRGERVLYVTLSETRNELIKVARSHGWSVEDLPMIELSAIESLLNPEARTTVFHASEMELNKVSGLLIEEARKTKPARVVFDSLSEFRLMAESALLYRRQLLRLKQEFAHHDSTVLMLDDRMEASGIPGDPHVLSLSHGVIDLEQMGNDYGVTRRRLRVSKLRGVKYREGFHDYTIVTGGLRVFPRLIAAEHQTEFRRQPLPSGIPELDELFGGGLDRGTSTLILGPAGSGKSTLALKFAIQTARLNQKSAVFIFDETRGILLSRAGQLGLSLEPFIRDGLMKIEQIDPAEVSPGEFAQRIVERVQAGCQTVIIDSLNGYLNAMPGEKYLTNQLHELNTYLNQQGVVTILIMAQHGLLSAIGAPVDLSYLADMVVLLRFFESTGEIKQALSVIKKRSGFHEKTIREFKLETGTGIHVGPPLHDFQGILTGVPVFCGGSQSTPRPTHDGR